MTNLILNNEEFLNSINTLHAIIIDFDDACAQYKSVSTESYTEAIQLNQFKAPLDQASDMVRASLDSTNSYLKGTVEAFSNAFSIIEGVDDAQKQEYQKKFADMSQRVDTPIDQKLSRGAESAHGGTDSQSSVPEGASTDE